MPFAQWMFQRPLTHYQSLSANDKSRIDPILDVLGGLSGLNERIVTLLVFENHRIRIGEPLS